MSQNSKFVFPIRSSLVKEPEAFTPPPRPFPSAAKRELTPLSQACQQLFFEPENFFPGRRAMIFTPAQKRESSLARCRCQLLFFKKPAVPRSALRRRPASETCCPAAAKTGYAPLSLTCQRLFIFFSLFFSRQTPRLHYHPV